MFWLGRVWLGSFSSCWALYTIKSNLLALLVPGLLLNRGAAVLYHAFLSGFFFSISPTQSLSNLTTTIFEVFTDPQPLASSL
jgi:hypothetical protein